MLAITLLLLCVLVWALLALVRKSRLSLIRSVEKLRLVIAYRRPRLMGGLLKSFYIKLELRD
jgi:hypothetical protein